MLKLVVTALVVAALGAAGALFFFLSMDASVRELMQSTITSEGYECSTVEVEGFQPADEQDPVRYYVTNCPEGRYAVGVTEDHGEIGAKAARCADLAGSGYACEELLDVLTPSPLDPAFYGWGSAGQR